MTPCHYASTATFSSVPLFSLHALTNKQHKAFVVFFLLYYHKESQTRDTRSTIIATGATNIRRAHDHSDCASYCDWSCVYIPCEPDLCIRAGVGKLSPLLIPVVECPSHRGVRRTASLARGPAREIGSRLASSRCVPGTLTNPFHHC